MKVDIIDPKGKKHSIQALCNGLCQIIASLYQKFVSVTFFETFHIISVCMLVAQSCPTLCDPMDCSPPASSVHGIFQARVLEWVAVSSSRGSFPTQGSNPLLHWLVDSLLLTLLGSPHGLQ